LTTDFYTPPVEEVVVVVVVPSQGIKQPGWKKDIDNNSIVQMATSNRIF
jgi:hypothetical protein